MLSYSQVLDIAHECNVSIQELPLALTFLHEQSKLLWFNDTLLSDVVILDAVTFFANAVSLIIRNHVRSEGVLHRDAVHERCERALPMDWDNMLQTGVVSEALLKGLLEDHLKNYDILLRLMVKFGLVVPFRSAEERKKFLVPSLIPLSSSVNPLTTEKQSTFFIAFYNNASGSGETDFRLRGFLPNGLFEKLIGKVFD